ncbi:MULTISPECIES: ABC-three component system middle component 7 [Acinetobacter]|uniref:Uncharacterized protein n=1 Tax=Acinetobacter haemolyticus TaxID=29430 RepID=A0A6L9DZ68_ACIHA|nr:MULTISPECIES: ABC-three component system middle component 7 [Acinetobacter]EEH69469.1 hypothetical protein HMPREF0023_1078 [Acinetobacter sp. ATCC 27244]ENW17496.1 hypothetical protein F926_03373 [Acinetobacter haemolyticus NIPH 261]NAR49990.1 hypothetical protein [Acinetobacter haemolyticus]NAR59744.1 hypothetical protein [Acinetobacter haemolyticus]QHI11582.1 hypothetical protein AhaeAN59_16740 [Acinetobacter haemolyticus]
MITPNKTISLKDSIIYKSIYIMEEKFEDIHISVLYNSVMSKFDGVDEFMYSIDTLYLLDLINFDFELGIVSKC